MGSWSAHQTREDGQPYAAHQHDPTVKASRHRDTVGDEPMMSLILTPARSGHGLMLRDTNTRAQILIEGQDLIDIGSALLRAAALEPPVSDRRGPGR
jgi:hypothetical protein